MGLTPVYAWPLAWVALAPLWWIAQDSEQSVQSVQSVRRALLYAAIWGVVYHAIALSWVTGLHPLTWMGVPWLASIAIALSAWIFVSLWGAGIGITWMALMMGLNRWWPVSGLNRVLIGTALWCAIEWVWSKGPLYWTSLSFTQSPGNLWALHLGQLAGPMAVTAAVVAVNGLVAEGFGELGLRASELRGFAASRLWGFGRAISLFLVLHLLGFGLYIWPSADSADQALAVGLIQGNIPTRQKLTAQGIQRSRQVYLNGYETLTKAGVDIVITPEGALPQVWDAFLQADNLFQRAVNKAGVPLVLGTFVHEQIDNPQTPLTQSLLTLTPDGKVMGRYNKIKLVPLGEYIPFESVLGALIRRLSLMEGSMVPGSRDQLLQTPFGPMAAGICYEAAYADLYQEQVQRGGQAIFTGSNNDPYAPRQMIQHHAQDVMRAVETDRWAVRVTNTGISGVVDSQGRSRWLSVPDTYTTHIAHIYRRQTQTLYVRAGDWLTPVLLGLAAIALFRQVPINRRH